MSDCEYDHQYRGPFKEEQGETEEDGGSQGAGNLTTYNKQFDSR